MSGMHIPGVGTLTIECAMVEATRLSAYADDRWKYTDQQGHRHVYRDGYPTLKRVVDKRYWVLEDLYIDEGGDPEVFGPGEGPGYWVEDAHCECPKCGEVIDPDVTRDTGARFAPGMRAAFLDGVPISGERAEELLAMLEAGRE